MLRVRPCASARQQRRRRRTRRTVRRAFGCDRGALDSTLWVGSRGCHTPLHYDTYGRNLVAQLHGTKRWTLFPPSATELLRPTRYVLRCRLLLSDGVNPTFC